ncbi:hypothetical protein EGM51_15365 [Verrucomicrobia bacterium S94]|nr:hypothetical protein EGM51_15365 [Verrucomicrobia bacterium S94]
MIRKTVIAVMFVCFGLTAFAEKDLPEIKVRDLELEGLMVKNGPLSLIATFDVRKEAIVDDLVFDFYLWLEPRNDDYPAQYFHCRTVHRFLEEQSNYISAVELNAMALKIISPRRSKYALVVSYKGEEVAVENSENEKRWWEEPSMGTPIENMLSRSSTAPIVRIWESAGNQ